MEILREPWPWYVAGPIIGLMVPLLLILANKQFGISSTMRHICASCVPTKAEYFQYDWKSKNWSLVLVLGILIGSFLAGTVFHNPDPVQISEATKTELSQLGITNFSELIPQQIFNWKSLTSPVGWIFIVLGGFLVGFGARYANGCTSGHSIMGMSLLNIGSLVATIGFFIGGLIVTHLLLPLLLNL